MDLDKELENAQDIGLKVTTYWAPGGVTAFAYVEHPGLGDVRLELVQANLLERMKAEFPN